LAIPPRGVGSDAFRERTSEAENLGRIVCGRVFGPGGTPVVRFGPPFGEKERAHSDADVVRLPRLEVLELYAVNARESDLVYEANAH
jgi:hypothetical protein